MKKYTVAVLGASGAVGRQMLQVLQERGFPVGRIIALSGKRSAGETVDFCGEKIPFQEANAEAFRGADLVLGAANSDIARQFAGAITEAGAVFIDNSSAFRLQPEVPLVVPEVNGADALCHRGIIANPNCSTIITLTAIGGLHRQYPIVSMVASTYQAVSGAGAAGPVELENQLSGQDMQPHVFPYPIARNVIPQIGGQQEAGYTSEEMKLLYESRKILHLPQLQVSCTCVRVPVVRSHCICLQVRFDRPVSVQQARQAIAGAPGCRLADDLENRVYPMPLHTSGQDLVYVGRIRRDLTDENGLCLWCCGDQIRKGAATNAVQIAELLTARTE